jgi:hypothetical protein
MALGRLHRRAPRSTGISKCITGSNILNTIRVPADQSFPYRVKKLGVFAALRDGMGRVHVHVEIIRTSDMRVMRRTSPVPFEFPSRGFTVYAVLRFSDVLIPGPEAYMIEMYCDDELIDDQPLRIVHGSGVGP